MTTHDEAKALTAIAAAAHDRPPPDGAADVWAATLADVPFGLARRAVVEIVASSPYWPRPADIRERARLIVAQERRDAAKRKQIADRDRHAITAATTTPAARQRTGPNMVRHILGRLKDAGQDVAAGKLLGKERASIIAEAAVAEWLDRTEPAPPPPAVYDGPQTACPGCYRPHDQPAGTRCAGCLTTTA